MRKDIYSFALLLFVLLSFTDSASPQAGNIKQSKLTKFDLQSSDLISASGAEISTLQYKTRVYWFPVTVPSTVLTGLVANKIYPDPYSGLNNMLIPDASDEFNKKYSLEQYSYLPDNPNPWKNPYWYRTTFNVPAGDHGRCFQLIFKGINYRAAVWLNGRQIADSTEMAGMFAEYSLDVSSQIKAGSDNVLAVKIYPLDYPGLPATEQLKAFGDFFENGGPTGDIGKNVTMLCSIGWDWIPPVRDRNMGIWLPVYLRTSGGVTIADPKIVTALPDLPDTTKAKISLNLRLVNHNRIDENGKLKVIITPENFKGKPLEFSKNVAVTRDGPVIIDLNADNTKELNIQEPVLWWPNGYGKPNLYRIRLQYSDKNGISDDTSFVFGIRTVSTKAVSVNGFYRRDFYINEKRVHLTGGAWVPDMMLNRDSARYDYEMHLCRNSNINLVRIWGGGVTPCDEFFEAADRYGLMVWSDFWITGDTQGEFKGSPDWPLEGNIFIKNVKSTILRIRNHPSLLVWTGGNEGHARKELYDSMRESIISLDGTRPFIPSSSGFARLPSGWNGAWPDNLPSGAYSGGPYTWQDPKVYYSKATAGRDWVFKDETGIPSQPPYNIMSKIIPDLTWDNKLLFPLNNSWGYHDACTGNGRYDLYYKEMIKRYGDPASMEDFCNKMQLMNAVGYQGIFEAAGYKLNDIGGVLLWKVNSAFPSVVWQVYDWFLMPNAGYYFMQNACEPVHIQLNPLNLKVMAINRTYHTFPGLIAEIDIFGMDSKSIFHEAKNVVLTNTEVKETVDLSSALSGAKGVNFVVLNLKNYKGKVISHNVYWLSNDGDYKPMQELQKTKLDINLLASEKSKIENSWTIQISNNTGKLAFFIRTQLMLGEEEVLPSYWTSNYFTLAPGENTTLTVSCPAVKSDGKNPEIKISGWNVNAQELSIK
jgi:Exo-beta-D-glucosaminidase Ig-fold domain/Glycosyl hydrolases family 2/Glycosyl hydrolases family 2, sugar binding domain/Glycosyl hydrolases family 2, TIM barrel domain